MSAMLSGLFRQSRRALSAAASRASEFTIITKPRVAFVAGALAAMPMMTGDDFFEHKFVTRKAPDDIIDFYSTEDFLQIIGVFPFAIQFVLAGVEWDTEKENTMAVHHSMEISFEMTEREEETPEGEKVVAFFQKRERFKNFIPFTPFLMWDQVQCYGYNRKEDGLIEVFHRGEHFFGPFPVRLLVQLHARYVIWATEKHINSPTFGSPDLEKQEHQRSNIPKHALKDFVHRLAVAQQLAIASGKMAMGTSTEEAEKSLEQLHRLKATPTMAYVSTLRKANLRRHQSKLSFEDPEVQSTIEGALANMSKTKEGQDAATAALRELMSHPELRLEEPRHGGAYKARNFKGAE